MSQNGDRNQLLESGQKLRQAQRTIEDAQKTALATEDTGFQVLSDLARQRETIERTQAHVTEMDENITGARRILVRMHRHVLLKRATVYILALLLLVILVFILYYLFKKK